MNNSSRVKNDTRRGSFSPKNNDSRMKSLGEETFSCHCCISLVYQYMELLGISSGSDINQGTLQNQKNNIIEFSFSTQQNLICSSRIFSFGLSLVPVLQVHVGDISGS